MQRINNIKAKLAILKPYYLEIIDESHAHKRHFNSGQLQETHLKIKISADIFHDMTKVKQHTMINELLIDEFKEGLHALSIKVII